MKTTTVHAPKYDPPPKYTSESVATTGTSNRSFTATHIVECTRIQGPNGLVCQKEVAITYLKK